jgi:glycogen synthase
MHALVTADTIGGVWTYVRELVTALARRGVRVTLVSFGEIPTQQQTLWMDALPDVDFRPTAFRLEWMQDSERDIELSSDYLASIIREVKPDILHLNQYCYGDLPVDIPRIVVAHSDVVSWWLAVHGEHPPDSAWIRWYRETVLRGIAGATAVVAPSRWMMDSLCEHYARLQRSAVIYNGRNPHLFSPLISKQPYALSVGRLWDSGKQISLLKLIDPPLPVHVAGAESHPETGCSDTASSAEGLHYRGTQTEPQLRTLYARAAIYIATSCYEPFGLAPLEAALSRCAIIANDIPTFREIWGDTVCYFRTNDPSDLQSAFEKLAGDENLRVRYANASYRHAVDHYSTDGMVDAYLQLYRSFVAAETTVA